MENRKVSYQTTKHTVTPTSRSIDYFELPVSELTGDGFNVQEETVSLGANEYMSINDHLGTLDDSISNTTVFNIQTGKGKTTVCYDLIERYANQGYVVLVLSPFIKLVEKDYPALQAKGLSVFNYKQLPDKKPNELEFDFVQYDVHVMTINCLLKNPGGDAYEQAAIKQGYLETILDLCRTTKTKVVMFFDELHESIGNFHAEYFPNLARWKDVVHKCFVASATFTPASVPALKYISYLTDGNIHIYDTPRVQIGEPVSLHLHIVKESYSVKNIAPLAHLAEIITLNKNKVINILVGHKSIIMGLTGEGVKEAPDLVAAIQSLNPNIVTSETTNPFDRSRNNLGTNFKTGIDIQDTNSLFIVILPCIKDNRGEYGIFSDGLPSLVQSMARLRRGGEVHVFMLAPSVVIEKSIQEDYVTQILWAHKEDVTRSSQSSFYQELEESYIRRKSKVQATLNDIESVQQNTGLRIEYRYPVFNEYLTEKSQNHLMNNHFEWGKELSPFVFWAAMNNQFTNGVLKEVTVTGRKRNRIAITKTNVSVELKGLASVDVLQRLTTVKFREGIELLTKAVSYAKDGTPNVFVYKKEVYSANEMVRKTFFMQGLIDVYVGEATVGKVNHLTKEDYILANTLQAGVLHPRIIEDEMTLAYFMLSRYRLLLLDRMERHIVSNNKGERLIHKEVYRKIRRRYTHYILHAIDRVKKNDGLLRSKIYAFLPTLPNGSDLQVRRESIYKALEACFLNVTGVKKTCNGQKDAYYLVGRSIVRELPKGLKDVSFL